MAVRFGGVQALADVSLDVAPGQITGLIGPNGAGKTTLFNVMTGLQRPNRGRVMLDGSDITRMRPHRRARRGLARTFQRLEIFGTLSVRENVLLAAETQRSNTPPGTSAARFAQEIIERVGLGHVTDEPADALPTGLARLVELGRALATNPSVLLLDEPSSGLDTTETEALGHLLVGLAQDGLAILLVEHDMGLVMKVCQEVNVLDFGHIIAIGPPAKVQADPAVREAYLGGGENAVVGPDAPTGRVNAPPAAKSPTAPAAAAKSPITPNQAPDPAPVQERPPALVLSSVSAAYGRIEVITDVTLNVPAGGVFALLGPNGAGKSTLLRLASGRMRPTRGQVAIFGEEVGRRPAEWLARHGVCAIPEGRGVFPNLSVTENLRMHTYRRSGLSAAMVEERTYARFPRLGERRRQLAGTLSGGEQQMLAMARALSSEPELLLLDEISMGLAPMVVAELYEVVGQLARDGITILLVEQFAQTALAVADRAAILVNGQLIGQGSPQEMADYVTAAYMGEE